VPVLEPTDTLKVAEPLPRLLNVTLKLLELPEPDGTAPKLTLTGSSAALAFTAESKFSRPEPTALTSVSEPPVDGLLTAVASDVLTRTARQRNHRYRNDEERPRARDAQM